MQNSYTSLNRLGLYFEQGYQHVPVKGCAHAIVDPTPRLVDPIRGQKNPIDRPPLKGEVWMDDVYQPALTGYGKNYSSYRDMNTGHIQYWDAPSLGEVYFRPVYTTPGQVTKVIRETPMGERLPEYPRVSFASLGWDPCRKEHCDSFTHDTLEHRQELMQAQQRKQNQSDWNYFHRN